MNDVLQLLPVYAFMLIPVWIPLTTALLGRVYDVLRAPVRRTPARKAALRPAGPRVPAAGTAR